MEIKKINDLYSDENTYFLIENGEAIVIDPGCSYEKIKEFSIDFKIKYIFLTHCHFDHICSVNKIIDETGALVCASSECAENIKNINVSLTQMGLGFSETIDKTDLIFEDGDEFNFCGNKIKIIKTPGHTNCSVCYKMGNSLFTGDTVFYQSVGRSDLPTGNGNVLHNSIKTKIYNLPDETVIYPGHGRETSVGYEKKFNFFVKG